MRAKSFVSNWLGMHVYIDGDVVEKDIDPRYTNNKLSDTIVESMVFKAN